MTETPDERRARQLAEYDHNHTPTGAPIARSGLQDATSVGCLTCGLTAAEPWAHALTCPHYTPHPASIAAQH
ncbi:hypothetical protein J1G42_05935 [Cellulomonas sp. zg-ZUI222]|uniref:hypothetical protein n=1 Tax=Cellulomonas wangleii TaxID=2816956 RepID=UPI001A943F46|nr:hypothetical protein [Cellulomonas wangleii]MBO0920363.1 hypothetical protein [Cellulomonas wangleii]